MNNQAVILSLEAEMHSVQCEMMGAISENHLRSLQGEAPAYGARHFSELADQLNRISDDLMTIAQEGK